MARLRKPFVDIFCRVFFQVQPRDTDSFPCALVINFNEAAGGQRQFVLRNLVTLGQVGIKIILARKPRMLVHGAVDRQRSPHGHFDRTPVQNR